MYNIMMEGTEMFHFLLYCGRFCAHQCLKISGGLSVLGSPVPPEAAAESNHAKAAVLHVVCFPLPLTPRWCNPIGEIFLTKCGAEPQTLPIHIRL